MTILLEGNCSSGRFSSMGAGAAEDEKPSELLLKCLNNGRVDVLCSILSQLKNKPDFHDQVDSLCCDEGTLLHRAVGLDGKTPYQMCKSDVVRNAFVQEALRAITVSNNGRLCQLISSGVSVDSVDSKQSRNSLLNWASEFSTVDIVRTLCEGGANVDLPNAKGETPLFTAVRRGDEQITRQLLLTGADPSRKTDKGEDVFSLATAKGGALLPLLSMDKVARAVRRTQSVESVEYDRASMVSCDAVSSQLFLDRTEKYPEGKLESWTDLLWPQPKLIRVYTNSKGFDFPKDSRLKIYFCDASSGCPRRMMQAIQISAPFLSSVNLDLEYRGHKTADHEFSPLDGKVTCGIFDDGRPSGSYSLTIDSRGVEIVGSDYCGVRYGFATLVQIIRLQRSTRWRRHLVNTSLHSSCKALHAHIGFVMNRHRSLTTFPYSPRGMALRMVPSTAATTAAYPTDGCSQTILEVVGIPVTADTGRRTLSYLDYPEVASSVFSGFCELSKHRKLPGDVIPCLTVRDIPDRPFRAIYQDFSGCRILNTETLLQLATRLSYCKANFLFMNFEVRTTDRYQLPYTNRDLFHMMQVCDELFVTLVPSLDTQSNYIEPSAAREIIEHFLDDFPLSKTAHFGPNLSSILIANRNVLASIQRRVPRIFLSSHVDEKNAEMLSSVPSYVTLCVEGCFPFDAEKLLSPRVSLVLKFSTAMPPSLSYMSLLASLGVAWNGSCDMKKYAFLQPAIAAHHLLMDGDMTALFEQAATLGRVEHELTKFACGIWRPPLGNSTMVEDAESQISGLGLSKKAPISVFVEMILNPENLNLERLTPVIFKKARIELRRSLLALDAARKTLPYNFELALVLAEIKLVTELMVLTSRLGQALCMHGARPMSVKSREEGFHYSPGRVGVAHLPLTVRTDLANSLLEIRTQFQHVWLSRSIPSTLPNALKMFDNLFRYNPENVGDLARCVQTMASENQYDRDIVLTVLKLYQLNPDKFDESIVRLVLLKTLMVLPASDFALAKCLIDSNRLGSQVNACRVISVTFQNIEKSVLGRLLGGVSDKQVAEYAKKFGWEEKPDNIYFIANHEATIRTRNIDEKLQFSNVAEILRNIPGVPVLEE
ncbi:unnamed protein product [Nippostrongylus brasiliensis]|uniref:ANK_REP_REGION domain-containing protein n=1 Tax=Nippostrongylus brasiliensis TaxID=27835 RepID=A0A0N4Y8G5_NIPBR|nr:unnamed protein product [Nippostrongylus brasiliensis]